MSLWSGRGGLRRLLFRKGEERYEEDEVPSFFSCYPFSLSRKRKSIFNLVFRVLDRFVCDTLSIDAFVLPAVCAPKFEGEEDEAEAAAEAADDDANERCSVAVDDVDDEALRFCCCCCCCWLEDEDSVVAVARNREKRGRALRGAGEEGSSEERRGRGRGGKNEERTRHRPDVNSANGVDVDADRELARLFAQAEDAADEVEEEENILAQLLLWILLLLLCTLEAAARTARIQK